MKKVINVLFYLFIAGSSCGICQTQKVHISAREGAVGLYQIGRELIHLMPNNLFYFKRVKQPNDAFVAECTDTLAKGKWELLNNNVLLLKNSLDYNQILFDIKQVKKYSDDSVYIKIEVPSDNAFFKGRFEFYFFFFNGIGSYQSSNEYIVLPKDKVARGSTCDFSLTIKDGYPKCDVGKKCYQRIYFSVFEGLRKEVSLNYFVITLPNFTECFVEQMDVNNDLLYYNSKNTIFWRGKEFKKIE